IVVAVVISSRRQVGIADDSSSGDSTEAGRAVTAAPGPDTTGAAQDQAQEQQHVTTPDPRG
ncbi:MAG TPA: hypothetical protein VFU98_17830, partial [Microlunatus sp.]|nr:hypothetical protein [Microlunatus sp.]